MHQCMQTRHTSVHATMHTCMITVYSHDGCMRTMYHYRTFITTIFYDCIFYKILYNYIPASAAGSASPPALACWWLHISACSHAYMYKN